MSADTGGQARDIPPAGKKDEAGTSTKRLVRSLPGCLLTVVLKPKSSLTHQKPVELSPPHLLSPMLCGCGGHSCCVFRALLTSCRDAAHRTRCWTV